jgi:hypothetical protein
VTRREARIKLREATGISMADCLRLIPEPGASREILAGMMLQGILASHAGGLAENKIMASSDYADRLIDMLAEDSAALAAAPRKEEDHHG